MHIALTGASGFIGSVVARRLAEAGHTVAALVRPTSRRDHIAPWVSAFVEGAQDDEAAWPALLDGADAVVHNSVDWQALKATDSGVHLRSNLLGSIRLLEAAGERQFVFMSTIAVHHDMRPRWQGRIDEDHPLRPGTAYGAAKAAVEAHLWWVHAARGVSTCALRPCAVYGMDPSSSRTIGEPIVRRLAEQRRFARSGGGKFVHVDDVAATVVGAIGNPDAAGVAVNLVDCYARWSDLARMAAELLGIDAEIDESSPPAPKNTFDKTIARGLGAGLDRGHEGLREHLRELIERAGITA